MSKMPGVANGHPQSQWAGHRASGYDYSHDMPPHKQDGSPRHRPANGYSSDQHSDNEEGPTYQLEHLATFAMGRDNGISDPKDGMTRLLQMEKSNGIWTQRMQMRLERKWVLIIDFETGDTVEKFPIHLINSPMAFMGNDPKELYNNILIFIVKEEKQKNYSPSEMHIFQITSISAQEVVEDMKLFMAGKWKGFSKQSPQRNSNVPTPEPMMNGAKQHAPNRFSTSPEALPGNPRDSLDETSSTSSEKYEREVVILNHCFDDIERFIARLQSSAAAHKELERRRRSRKSKKKDHGDGMLSMRAKPPPEREFVDVFQKFKLSFNLLAKLKSHIHDPNAPELVHFLFTPLALIVDASRDSNYGPNLASKVVAPLLLKEALDLLANCLTSKESDLWHSLGDAWVISRDQWKGYVSAYRPIFSDGWSPDYIVTEDRGVAELTAAAAAIAAQKARREDLLKAQREADFRDQDYHRSPYYYDSDISGGDRPGPSPVGHSPQMEYRSDISVDSIERSGLSSAMHDPQKNFERQQKLWLDELRSRDAKVVQVVFPRTANNEKELTVFRGEYLEVLDDTRKWWKARNIRGMVAHVPHTIVTAIEDDAAVLNTYTTQARPVVYVQDSPGRSTDSGSVDRQKPIPIPPPAPSSADWVKSERQAPVPPPLPVIVPVPIPPPPPVVSKNVPLKKTTPKKNVRTNVSEGFDDELRKTLDIRRKSPFGKHHDPLIYIADHSTPTEVQSWMESRGFDKKVQNMMAGHDGHAIFKMNRREMEHLCGKEDGSRLHSQVNVQKSVSGYKTHSAKELQDILAKRRERSELPRKASNDDDSEDSDDSEYQQNSHGQPRMDSHSKPLNRNDSGDDDDDKSSSHSTLHLQIQKRKQSLNSTRYK